MKSLVLNLLAITIPLVRAKQPKAPDAIPAPLRDLKFGTINFLHTTDTHGWHAGHLGEASYSADWGDYFDFSARLREQIEADGNDLLIIDSGDRVEGNGLYDSSDPQGKYTFPIFTRQHMDVICTGNHELYKATSALNDYNILVPRYHEAYIASNLDIQDPKTGQFVPLARRFRKITTPQQGIRILAFGFLFDFNRNDNNTRITPVEAAVKQPWFQEVIRDQEIDLFVITAHVMARGPELQAIFAEIRAVHPNTPIQFFAGHQHIRDYKKFDDNAYALASGRFLETIGFQSIDGIQGGGGDYGMSAPSTPTWFRRYIDNNLYSFYKHSKSNASSFHSKEGKNISKLIETSRHALGLDKTLGCAPQDLWMARAPVPANDSIYTWLNDTVFPDIVVRDDRKEQSRFVLINTGAIRFDLFKGPYTTDTQFIISPFTSKMNYIKDVPLVQANRLTALLNTAGQILATETTKNLDLNILLPPEQLHLKSDFIPTQHISRKTNPGNQIPLYPTDILPLLPGYTTTDDAGSDGDDTIHSAIPFYRIPNVIQSYVSFSNSSTDKADMIFNAFLDPYIIQGLKSLGISYTETDIDQYLPGESMTDLITKWVVKHWSSDC